MRESLSQMNIQLNRKSIANLAIFEPRSFKAVVELCAHKGAQPQHEGGLGLNPSGPGTKIADPNKLL